MSSQSVIHTTTQAYGPFEGYMPNATLTYELGTNAEGISGSIRIEVAHGDQFLLDEVITDSTKAVIELRVAGSEIRIVPLDGATFTFEI